MYQALDTWQGRNALQNMVQPDMSGCWCTVLKDAGNICQAAQLHKLGEAMQPSRLSGGVSQAYRPKPAAAAEHVRHQNHKCCVTCSSNC